MQNKNKEESKPPTSMTDIFKLIIQKEGLQGLFTGYVPKITQSVLTAAILFLAKEKLFNATLKLLIFLGYREAIAASRNVTANTS